MITVEELDRRIAIQKKYAEDEGDEAPLQVLHIYELARWALEHLQLIEECRHWRRSNPMEGTRLMPSAGRLERALGSLPEEFRK